MSKIKITEGSGNVYEDIGLPDAKVHALKAALVSRIARVIAAEKITQREAAKRVALSEPDLSKMLNGHFRSYSLEKLMLMLTELGQDVRIRISAPTKPKKTGSVTVAA